MVANIDHHLGLRHVEFELVDDPGVGFKSFFQDTCTKNLNQIVLQVYLDILKDTCIQEPEPDSTPGIHK